MSFVTDAFKSITGQSSASAAKNAGQLQAASADKAAEATLKQYEQTRSDLQPYNQTGLAGNTQLSQGLNNGSLTRSFNMNDFQEDPSYQFVKQQGLDNIQSQAAAKGGLLSGATLKALNEFNNNLASQQYQQSYTNYNNDQSNRYNRLMGITQLGQNSAAQVGAQGAAATAQANDYRTSGASALGAGMIGAANARAQGYGNLIKTGTQIAAAFA